MLYSPSILSLFDHSKNIWRGVQFTKLLNKQSPAVPYYFARLRNRDYPQHLITNTQIYLCSPHTYKATVTENKAAKVGVVIAACQNYE